MRQLEASWLVCETDTTDLFLVIMSTVDNLVLLMLVGAVVGLSLLR